MSLYIFSGFCDFIYEDSQSGAIYQPLDSKTIPRNSGLARVLNDPRRLTGAKSTEMAVDRTSFRLSFRFLLDSRVDRVKTLVTCRNDTETISANGRNTSCERTSSSPLPALRLPFMKVHVSLRTFLAHEPPRVCGFHSRFVYSISFPNASK